MSLVDTMIVARDLLKKGWQQDSYFDFNTKKPCFCLGGALAAAKAGVTLDNIQERLAAQKTTGADFLGLDGTWMKLPVGALKALGFKSQHDLFSWNDAEGRTVGQVIYRINAGIRNAAASLAAARRRRARARKGK